MTAIWSGNRPAQVRRYVGLHGPDAPNTLAGRNHLTARHENCCRGISQALRGNWKQRDGDESTGQAGFGGPGAIGNRGIEIVRYLQLGRAKR